MAGKPKEFLLAKRLKEKLAKFARPVSGCFIWTGPLNEDGYGILKIKLSDGRWVYRGVHRLVCESIYGPLPIGMETRHSCDTPACVRASHLYFGTHKQNMADMKERGRGRGVPGNQHTAGRTMPDDERRVRSESNKGKKRSTEQRAHQAEAARRRWAKVSTADRRAHLAPALSARMKG